MASILQTIFDVVHDRKKKAFLDSISSSVECLTLFKANVHSLNFCAEDIEWMFHTIYEKVKTDNQLRLARHVACKTYTDASGRARNILVEFYCSHPNDFSVRKKADEPFLKELYHQTHKVSQERKCEPSFLQCVRTLCDPQKCRKWKDNQKILFRFAYCMKDVVLMAASCGIGVGKQEVNIVKDWFVAEISRFGENTKLLVSSLARMTDVVTHSLQAWFKQVVAEILITAVIKSKGQCFYTPRGMPYVDPPCVDWYSEKASQIFEILVEHEAFEIIDNMWQKDVKLWARRTGLPYTTETRVLDLCLDQMLTNKNVWQKCASLLDSSIEQCRLQLLSLPDKLQHLQKFVDSQRQFSLESLSKWCVENSFPHLALLLALVSKDLRLLTFVLNTEQLVVPVPHSFWKGALLCLVEKGHYDLAAILLKTKGLIIDNRTVGSKESTWYSVDRELTRLLSAHPGHNVNLVQACLEMAKHDPSLYDWALILSVPDTLEWPEGRCVYDTAWSLFENVMELSEDFRQLVLEVVFEKLSLRCTEVMKKFLFKFSYIFPPDRFRRALYRAFSEDFVKMAEVLFEFTDPTNLVTKHSGSTLGQIMTHSVKEDGELMRLCVTSGVAAEHCRSKGEINVFNDLYCPLQKALIYLRAGDEKYLDVLNMLLNSGAYTCSVLKKGLSKREYERLVFEDLQPDDHDQMARAHELILNVVAIPRRLEHLARLEVSHAIGCRPGRKERIEALGISQPVKDLLNFKDVV